MVVQVRRLRPTATVPAYQTAQSAGLDLTAAPEGGEALGPPVDDPVQRVTVQFYREPGGVLWAEAGMMITAGGVGTGARGGGRRVLDSRVS